MNSLPQWFGYMSNKFMLLTLAALVALSQLSVSYAAPLTPHQSRAPKTIFVDAVKGKDTNNGAQATPLKKLIALA